ncbi:hypothetical protein [Clavibacter tessellarius]|uniref:hypothetical protein n=1 Tax=Clavibacter tessellarius TaxID=31965 RepID=UPI0032443BF2
MQPDVYEDLIADISLFRPGPMKGNMVAPFLDTKHGITRPDYLHPGSRRSSRPPSASSSTTSRSSGSSPTACRSPSRRPTSCAATWSGRTPWWRRRSGSARRRTSTAARAGARSPTPTSSASGRR